MNKLREYLNRFNRLPCPKCGSRERKWISSDAGDGLIYEGIEYCASCGTETNYWAYGHWDNPQTYSETLKFFWWRVKSRVKYWWKYGRGL